MTSFDVGAWSPRGVDQRAAMFAREVVAAVRPQSWARARSLLWATSRLCAFSLRCGLEPVPSVVLAPAVIERFIVTAAGSRSPAARRTLRSNLLFVRHQLLEADFQAVPLVRDDAKVPYTDAELASYLALCDAQPTPSRRARGSGLIALGAGAGLLGGDLRTVTGHDVVQRSGGVLVEIRGQRARVVPVRSEFAARALDAAAFFGGTFVIGGAEPTRRNVTSRLIASLSGGSDLQRLSLFRLRATWIARCAEDLGLATFMAAAGLKSLSHLGDAVASLESRDEAQTVRLLSGRAT